MIVLHLSVVYLTRGPQKDITEQDRGNEFAGIYKITRNYMKNFEYVSFFKF